MAEKLISSIREEYFTCSICLEEFQDPKRLPCTHSFCRQCLENHVTQKVISRDSSTYTTCPLCRREMDTGQKAGNPFAADKWVASLPSDSLIKALLQTFQRHETEISDKYEKSPSFCQMHDGCARDAYCFSHSQVMCKECISRDHASCEYGSTAEATQRLEPEIMQLQSTVGKYLSKAKDLGTRDKEYEDSRSQAQRDITQLDLALEEVYRSAKGQINAMKNDIDKSNAEWLRKRKKFYESAAKLLELNCSVERMVGETNPLHVLEAFPTIKTDALKVETELKAEEQNNQSATNRVSFVENRRVRDFLSTYSGVGFIETRSSLSNDDFSLESIPSTIAHILERGGNSDATANVPGGPVRKFEWSAKFDTESRFVPSGVLLVGAYVCVIDRENEKIKQFTMGGKFVDVIRISGQPHDATVTNRLKEVAVTQPDERLISFILADESGLKSDRFISTNVAYNGICLLDTNTIVVSSWSFDCIDIMDFRGNILKSIDRSTSRLENVPDLLCILPRGRIAITEVGCNVYGLDTNMDDAASTGKPNSFVWCYKAPDDVFGICSDGRGFIYVGLKDMDEIRCVNENGELYTTAVLSSQDGISKPIAVSCHGEFVLVGQEDGVIKIFQNVDHPNDDTE